MPRSESRASPTPPLSRPSPRSALKPLPRQHPQRPHRRLLKSPTTLCLALRRFLWRNGKPLRLPALLVPIPFDKGERHHQPEATFRHTCASLLFEAGRNVKQVQAWLGHADPGFTLKTYIHLMDAGVGNAAFLDQAIGHESLAEGDQIAALV